MVTCTDTPCGIETVTGSIVDQQACLDTDQRGLGSRDACNTWCVETSDGTRPAACEFAQSDEVCIVGFGGDDCGLEDAPDIYDGWVLCDV